MARSVSRPRNSASKSPARVKKMMSSPKSEPKRKKSDKIKVKSRSRSASKGRKVRSRSASKGRKGKQLAKSPKKTKSISRSRSRPRPVKWIIQKFSPLRRASPEKQEETKKPALAKTPSVKTPTTKAPVERKSSVKTTAPPKTPSVDTSSTSGSSMRPSRSIEKRTYTSTPFDYEMRQRFLRPESSSRSPVKITPKKSAPSACTGLYNRTCGTVNAAGRTVYGAYRAAYRSV
ncbi:hypothetical protein TELCIR_19588, partial [Teladorsagia circumcincta]